MRISECKRSEESKYEDHRNERGKDNGKEIDYKEERKM